MALSLIFVFQKRRKAVLFGFFLIFFCAGWLVSYQKDLEIKKSYTLKKEEDVSFEGKVIREPDLRAEGARLVVDSRDFGKTLVFLDRYPEYNYGDRLEIKGKVELPPVFEDFDYRKYLASQGIFSLSYKPEVLLLEEKNFSGIREKAYCQILSLKSRLKRGIRNVFPSPERYVLEAMILGDKGSMPESLKEKLNIAGLRHITAISGMHIIIIFGALMSFFSFLFSSFKRAFAVSFLFLLFFIAMVGFPYSAIRAGIMALAISFSKILGRPNASMRILALMAALMLLFNPLLLFYEAGFQLSFLAAAGIIYFKEPLKSLLKKVPFKDILAMTLSAQAFTLPVLIYNFGRIPLVSLFSNVLIVPILPYVMIFGLLAGITALFSFSLAFFASFPCQILLAYLIRVVDFFSSKKWASISIENPSWLWVIFFYLFLLALLFIRRFKKRGPSFYSGLYELK